MKQHELIYTLDTIDAVAEDLAEILSDVSVVTFTGSLGAGKTTLIQALLSRYAIHEDIQSPTFTYMNTYSSALGYTFYHFDLYRMRSMSEFMEAGFNEYLYVPQSWALIEWPEIIMPLLKKRVCHIAIDYHGENRRRLRYEVL